MVLDDEVEQVCGLLLDARVQFLAAEGLVDGTEGALETLVILDKTTGLSEFAMCIFCILLF